eukprot:13828356-Alexandrium_andersonii.AAC.1
MRDILPAVHHGDSPAVQNGQLAEHCQSSELVGSRGDVDGQGAEVACLAERVAAQRTSWDCEGSAQVDGWRPTLE